MTGKVKFRITLWTESSTKEEEKYVEFDREDWESLGSTDRHEALLDQALDMFEWDYEEV